MRLQNLLELPDEKTGLNSPRSSALPHENTKVAEKQTNAVCDVHKQRPFQKNQCLTEENISSIVGRRGLKSLLTELRAYKR